MLFATAALAGALRPGLGIYARPSRAPKKPLELWSFEASPFCRIAREPLCSLELQYVLRSCGGSTARDWLPPQLRDALKIEAQPVTVSRIALAARAGRISIPYLVDRTPVEMAESRQILEYLAETYG